MNGPAAPAWLLARPIAHRGLHAAAEGRLENTASAARAAITHGFAIECDVQLTRDGDAVVFHDADLDRLTFERGLVAERTGHALQAIPYRAGPDRIVTLAGLLDVIAGQVPLICEIKSRFDGDLRLTERVRALAAGYDGPIALKSFDPLVIAHLRADPPRPARPRGGGALRTIPNGTFSRGPSGGSSPRWCMSSAPGPTSSPTT